VNLLLDDDARSAVWEQGRVIVVLNYTALSFAIVMTLWGTTRLARQMELLDQASAPANDGEQTHVFGALNPVAGPLLASAATAAAFGGSSGVAGGWAAALVRGTTWFVLGIAIWTFLWTYGAVQLGLARFGRTPLHVEAVRADPALGLQPLGEVAFMGLWMLLVWLVPVLLTGLPDVVGAVVGLVVLTAALAAFFLPLLRLHRRMIEVKKRELTVARRLYAEAYQPVRETTTLETLERQQPLLGAAARSRNARMRSRSGRSTTEPSLV